MRVFYFGFVAKIRSYCFKVCYVSGKEKMESLLMQKITQKVIVGFLVSCWMDVAILFFFFLLWVKSGETMICRSWHRLTLGAFIKLMH